MEIWRSYDQGDQGSISNSNYDYCSVTPGVLQISTTTKNSHPEN